MFLLADIVNVHLQSFLIIAKEIIKTPALILTNVGKMVCVRNTMVEQDKGMCFNFFTLNQLHLSNFFEHYILNNTCSHTLTLQILCVSKATMY